MLSNLHLKTKLLLLVIVAAGSLVVFASASYMLRDNAEMAAQTRIYDDINAYAVLPDLNVVEAHVPVSEMLMVNDAKTLQELANHIKAAEAAYAAAEKDILPRLSDGRVKDAIQGDVHQTALQYYELVDQKFVPAVLRGDHVVIQGVLPELMKRYEAKLRWRT